MSACASPPQVSRGALFSGERGRLLAGLMAAELGTAVQTVAEAAVLPLASRDLGGASLYGATIAGPTLTTMGLIVAGPTLTARLTPRGALAASTLTYLAGVLLAALAPAMAFLFAGRLLQGAAAGLLAGFGLSAIGALYDDRTRPRVLGLFSAVWLLPSVLGPVANSAIAAAAGWRWALGWPALVVVGARLLIGHGVSLLPQPEAPPRPPVAAGLTALAGLVVAGASPTLAGLLRPICWASGIVVAVLAAARLVWTLIGRHRRRALLLAVFAGLCTSYFGSEGLLPLSVITVANGGVLGASIAYAAGATAWSLTGLTLMGARAKNLAPLIGGAAIATGIGMLTGITLVGGRGVAALAVSVAAWGIAGAGIGTSYRMLTAAAFDNSDATESPTIGAAVAFVETATVAVAALIGSGFYSLTAHTLQLRVGIGVGYLLTGAVAVAALIGAVVLHGLLKATDRTPNRRTAQIAPDDLQPADSGRSAGQARPPFPSNDSEI